MEYNPIDYENYIISTLNTALSSYKVKVTGSYPSGNKKFPLITTSIIDDSISRDIGKDGIIHSISLELKIWSSDKVEMLSIQGAVKEILLYQGFQRLSPTRITLDNSVEKLFVTEQFIINYNSLTGNFERSY